MGSQSPSRWAWSTTDAGSSRRACARNRTSGAMWCSCCPSALANQANGFGDRIVDVERAGVEQDRVLGLLQGCDLAMTIPLVAGADVDQNILVVRRHSAAHQLAH